MIFSQKITKKKKKKKKKIKSQIGYKTSTLKISCKQILKRQLKEIEKK